jgi:FAD:protein FMN transferase
MKFRVLLLWLLLLPALTAAVETTVSRARYVMGAVFEITARGGDEAQTTAAVEAAFAEIRRADEVLSHYREDSDLSRLNRAPAGEPVEVDQQLSELLSRADRLTHATGGTFRVTVAPLVELWQAATALPALLDRLAALEHSRSDCYRVLDDRHVARLTPGCRIEFGAIGKGWAVDQAVAVLRQRGVEHALVSAGTSTLYAIGGNGRDEGWPVSVRDPQGAGEAAHGFLVRDTAVSTSANYEQFRVISGREYGHIIDPRTGWPAEGAQSVTVVAPTGTEADALSTAVFVLGAEHGAKLLRKHGREGFIVELDGTEQRIQIEELARWK